MLVQSACDFSAIIYKRSEISQNNEVKWNIIHKIPRYPIILKGLSSANFLFSPSFDKFIDIDFISSEFVIKQASDETVINRIPSGMFSVSFIGREKSEAAI